MFTLNCKGRLVVADTPLVMGIVNITPDSFHESSRVLNDNALLQKVRQMLSEGADIIDIGAQSTRPQAPLLSEKEESDRLSGAIELILQNFPAILISIDTFYASIASNAINAGASMINDISGGNADPDILQVASANKVPYICMHSRGTIETMHQQYHYHDLTVEVMKYFVEKLDACKTAGIKDVIIDPGFGFSKTTDNNFELLRNLASFHIFEKPILVGLSRKSTISKTLGVSTEDSLNGTTVMNTIALMHGANILRVHDVKAAREAVKLLAKTQLLAPVAGQADRE